MMSTTTYRPCTTAYRQVTREQVLRKDQAERWPQLHPDAPFVPTGLQPRIGVEYGCGKADCADCYEPLPTPVISSFTKQIRFDRATGDYSMYLGGQYVGSRSTYAEAQAELDRLAWESLRRA